MSKDLQFIQPNRPSIITTQIKAISFYRKMDTKATVADMIAGKYVLVERFYSDGLEVLAELKRVLLHRYKDKSFQGERDFRSAFREASHRLLLKVKENKLLVRKCPDIGWLELLYPDVSEFYLSLPEVQGMNSSWQWYKKGIEIKSLVSSFFLVLLKNFQHCLCFFLRQ